MLSARINDRFSPTSSFDLIHTDLDLKPIWSKHQMEGEAMLKLVPYFYAQDKITIDAKSFEIHEVALKTNQGKKIPLEYNYNKRKLIIFLDKSYERKDTFNLYIKYTANPDSVMTFAGKAISDEKGLYFINTDLSQKGVTPHLWTQGETEANSTWFPTIDIPSEKHTQRIKLTYDQKLVSLSNGKLISSKINSDKTKTDIWEQILPHSVYLSVVVIGDFTIVKDKWKNKEVSYYMEPQYASMARPIFGRTPEMLEFFSNKLGYEFPWDKYAQVIVHEFVAGAMENTSAVTYNTSYQKDARELIDRNDDETVAHELMHHWFGDIVTCEDWGHLTLNESFANYAEYLWQEYKYGADAAQYHWQSDIAPYFSSANSKTEPLVRYRYEKADDMFDVISYNKGGKILHMLRTYLGDDAFFQSLKLYLHRHEYKTAEYSNLRMCFEEVSGEDLKWFFDQWYLKGGHPVLTSSYSYSDERVILKISQKHNFDTGFIYRLPLDVDIYTDSGVYRKRISLTQKSDSFVFKFPGMKGLVVDGTHSLVGIKNESKTTEDWIYLLTHSKNYLDQVTAIKKLNSKKSRKEVKNTLFDKLNSDKPRVVTSVVKLIDEEWLGEDPKWNQKLSEITYKNPSGYARAAAIEKLGENKSISEFRGLIAEKLKDSSYLVEVQALNLLSKIDSSAALNYALQCTRYKNYAMLSKVFELIAKTERDTMIKYFDDAISNGQGVSLLSIYSRLGTFVASQNDSLFEQRIVEFSKLAETKKGVNKYAGTYALNALKAGLTKRKDESSKKKLERVETILKNIKDETESEH